MLNKKSLREFIYNLVVEHFDETPAMYKDLTEKERRKMLNSIKKNNEDAVWAWSELLVWGFERNYTKPYVVGYIDDEYETPVYNVNNMLFTCLLENGVFLFKEVKEVQKVISTYEVL